MWQAFFVFYIPSKTAEHKSACQHGLSMMVVMYAD
jgi:hypothetical protein